MTGAHPSIPGRGIVERADRVSPGMSSDTGSRFPSVTAAQMREVDRVMTEEFGIGLVQMMENAGAHLAQLAISRFAPDAAVVLAGAGGNGGGGLAAARHLANRGVHVSVALPREPAPGSVPAHQLAIAERLGLPISREGEPEPAELVIDALIGYSLRGAPTGHTSALITWANAQDAPILALDVPSGFDATTGQALAPCVTATATLTLALPKTGLVGAAQTGELYLADIGVPPSVYARLDLEVPALFREHEVIRVR
jgi:NAD(P)H-hydrate epimerase